MSDLISTQESVTKIVDTAIRKILSGEQKLTKEYEQSVIEAVNAILDTARRERGEAEAQPDIVRCNDCMHYGTYYRGNESKPVITHLCKWYLDRTMEPDDYCSHAERRTNEPDK
jgi:hypothetical protein